MFWVRGGRRVSRSYGMVMLAAFGEGRLDDIHKEDFPSCERPVLIIQRDRGSAFDEEGDEDLDPVDELLYSGVGQVADPHFEFPASTCVGIDKLSRRLPVFRAHIILYP